MLGFQDGLEHEAFVLMPRPAMKPSFEVAPPDTGVLPQEILLLDNCRSTIQDVRGMCILAGRRCQRSTFAFTTEA